VSRDGHTGRWRAVKDDPFGGIPAAMPELVAARHSTVGALQPETAHLLLRPPVGVVRLRPAIRLAVAIWLAVAVLTSARADDVAQVCDPPVNTNCVVRQDKTFFPTTPSLDIGNLNLRIMAGHTLTVAASVTSPGQLTLKVGSAILEPGASVVVHSDTAGNGGSFALVALGDITLQQQGVRAAIIDASATTKGGLIQLTAGGGVVVNGLLRAAGTPGMGGDVGGPDRLGDRRVGRPGGRCARSGIDR